MVVRDHQDVRGDLAEHRELSFDDATAADDELALVEAAQSAPPSPRDDRRGVHRGGHGR